MENIRIAFQHLEDNLAQKDKRTVITFEEFTKLLVENPVRVIRNVFQVFHDMMHKYVGEGIDEYPDDPESINFIHYDCSPLFVDGVDHPFFADRLFANRLISQVEALRRGAQQNKIYIFDGPPGCGKSTFLNNLLMKFEEYTNTEDGMRYETVWKLDRNLLGGGIQSEARPLVDRILHLISPVPEIPVLSCPDDQDPDNPYDSEVHDLHHDGEAYVITNELVEVPCPSHDHPLLMIPKDFRRTFCDELFENDEWKYRLFTEKEYDWVFRENPCTICMSLYEALLN
ncbi:MAG: serine protein kinase PrkA, partial [Desulfatirhabdiaceae bacterium]